jgi:LmbE family N-acetylglucosaminyl deacetylase
MTLEHWIFISPHFDDVVLSCGGLVYSLSQQGHRVEIWTIMGGFPTIEKYSEFADQNHRAWGMSGAEAIKLRRSEDRASCEVLGAQARHFDWLDAIYRYDPKTGSALVNNNDELFSHPPEQSLVDEISAMLVAETPAQAHVVGPIGLGNHIDHRAVTQAIEAFPHIVNFYADYPYILDHFDHPAITTNHFVKQPFALSREALKAWQDAVLCYASQLSGFWRDEGETCLAIRNYAVGGGGRLWRRN